MILKLHHHRERVLFIGTQFSILYTSMYSPAGAASPSCIEERFAKSPQKQKHPTITARCIHSPIHEPCPACIVGASGRNPDDHTSGLGGVHPFGALRMIKLLGRSPLQSPKDHVKGKRVPGVRGYATVQIACGLVRGKICKHSYVSACVVPLPQAS